MAEPVMVILEFRIAIRTTPGNVEPTKFHVIDQVGKGLSPRMVHNAAIGLAAYDGETGRQLRRVEYEEPDPKFKKFMDYEFGTEETVA